MTALARVMLWEREIGRASAAIRRAVARGDWVFEQHMREYRRELIWRVKYRLWQEGF